MRLDSTFGVSSMPVTAAKSMADDGGLSGNRKGNIGREFCLEFLGFVWKCLAKSRSLK